MHAPSARRHSLRIALLGATALALSVLSCGREITSPIGGTIAGSVSLRPVFGGLRLGADLPPVSLTGIIEFARVRVVLLRANGDTVVNRVVEFPADSQSIALTLPVVLSPTAGTEGETFNASLRYVNTAGDTVFRGGPIAVQGRPTGSAPTTPPEIPLTYSGPGSSAASIAIAPQTFTGPSGKEVTFTATVRDAQGTLLPSAPVVFLSSDSALVPVGLRTGIATLRGLKGMAKIYAAILTGQRDSATVTVVAPPSRIGFVAAPSTIRAGSPLGGVAVAVLDATQDTIRGYVGTITMGLSGGTSGATLLGTKTATVQGGIARFPDLSVDKVGTGYRLTATLDSVTTVPAASSDTFAVTAGPPAALGLVAGGGQSISQRFPFPDSVVVRVTDRFGSPVPSASVRFEVVLGGGSVSPPTVQTGADGRAATQWTAGDAGGQRLRVVVDTLPALTVDGIAIPSNGPPLLYVGTEMAAVSVGRALPITAYLSNPARASTAITLRSRNDSIAQWTASTLTIPLNGTQGIATLTGRRLGSTWVTLDSPVGTDSIMITVDSTGMRFGPLPSVMLVGDTIRTQILLDAPAPAGGLTLTVRSADSLRVRIAPGSGAGPLEVPTDACSDCPSIRTDDPGGHLLATPSGTATLTVLAGQLSAQLVILPIAPASDTTGPIALVASAPGVSRVVSAVAPIARRFDASCFYCEVAVGHVDGMFIGTAVPLRAPLAVRLATPDPTILELVDSSVTLTGGAPSAYLTRVVVGRSAGKGRVILTAAGFAPETLTVAVWPRATRLLGYAGISVQVGSQLDVRAAFGFEKPDSGFGYNAPRPDSLAVTFASSDTTILQVDFTQRSLAPGSYEVRLPVTGRRTGTATLTVSAPGYGSHEASVEVVDVSGYVLDVPTTTGTGVMTPIRVTTPNFLGDRLAATELVITSSDTMVLRVVTPRVVLPTSATEVEALIEGVSPGEALLSVSRENTVVVTRSTQVIAGRLAISSAPSRLEAGESSEILVLTEADQVRSTTAVVVGVLRSSDPTVLQVTDSVLRFVPGEFGALGVVRGVGAGTASLVASVPGYPTTTLATITVSGPRLVVPLAAGAVRPGPGIEWRLPVERRSASREALPIAVSVSGSAGSSVVAVSDTIASGSTVREVRLRGGNATGVDTLQITASGFEPAVVVLPATTPWFTLSAQPVVPIEVPFRIGGGLALVSGFVEDTTLIRPVAAAPLRFRLSSLDTGLVRIVDDTVEIATGSSFATRLGKARGLRPGLARVTATLLGATGPVTDTLLVEVAVARLWHNVVDGALRLGMQQRTEADEFFIAREVPQKTPLWVRLTSSAPAVVRVPDSVFIPVDSAGVHLVVTAQDTVGTALVTATAPGHEGASFLVTVTRARLVVSIPWSLATGNRAPIGVFPIAGGYSDYYGTLLRQHTVPIPLGFRSGDTTVARWATDTARIATTAAYFGTGLTGGRVGRTTIAVEDRRTGFARLTPLEGTVEVRQAVLQVTGGYESFNGLPVVQAGLGLIASPQRVEIETNGYRDGLVVKFRSLKSRVGFDPDTAILRGFFVGDEEAADTTLVGLRGLVAGVDTVEVSAAGHRPDTLLIRIDKGYLEHVGPIVSTALRQNDSTLVRLALRSPSGDPARTAGEMTLTIGASTNLIVSGPGVTVSTGSTTLLLPAGASDVRFWIKGGPPGPSRLTVGGPTLRPFELQGRVIP